MVTSVMVPTQSKKQSESERGVSGAKTTSETRVRPLWRTIINVIFTVVIIAAVIVAGVILVPKLINFVAAAAGTAGAVADAATTTANTVTKIVKGAEHVLFHPIAIDVMQAVDTVATKVNAVTNGLFVNTVEKVVSASSVVSPKLAVMTYLPWLVLTAPKSFPLKGE